MNAREFYEAIYLGEAVGRLPVRGVGGWAETLVRWRSEGLADDQSPSEALGLVADDDMGLPLHLNKAPTFPIEIVEANDEYVTFAHRGATVTSPEAWDMAATNPW